MYNNYAPVFFGIAWNTWHNLFKTSTAPFIGHMLRPEGLKLSTEIVTAALDMPPPQDKAATLCFLGTITYLAKFCPNLSKVVRPLHNLTHLKPLVWAAQQSLHRGLATSIQSTLSALLWHKRPCTTSSRCLGIWLRCGTASTSHWPHWFQQHLMATSHLQFQLTLQLNSCTLKLREKFLPLFTPFTNSISSFSVRLKLRYTVIINP